MDEGYAMVPVESMETYQTVPLVKASVCAPGAAALSGY
jgi:hypothetical protein